MWRPILTLKPAFFRGTPAITPKTAFLTRFRNDLGALVAPGTRVLVGLSGGADSVALAHLLKQLSYPLLLVHINHQLRPTAHTDERFVRDLARRWKQPLRVVRVPVRALARRKHQGLEEAGRELRYATFERLARRQRCPVVATAHHADDQAETVLMHFLRGAGSTGLAGMLMQRPLGTGVRLIRPMLDVSRHEILAYLKAERLGYRQDPSNADLSFSRNRIRHRTLPSLELDYPGLRTRLVHMADLYQEEETYWTPMVEPLLRRLVRKDARRWIIDLKGFFRYHKVLGRRMLHALWPSGSYQEIERLWTLARSAPAGRVEHVGPFRVARQAATLVITKPRKL